MKNITKNIAVAIYILFLIVFTGSVIGAATRADYLIPAAVPFSLVLILILRFMNPKYERIAWAAFTVWLGSTYVQLGNPMEYGLFFAYIMLALLGVFKSPYYLAIAWLFHPVWDFIPRELPELYMDLPVACTCSIFPSASISFWAQKSKGGLHKE
ncbi:MAG: hypothetical protein HY863_17610 [Chloroflexi bacterium]|nr:hypothetical protein [Chloroflexota bacterium]